MVGFITFNPSLVTGAWVGGPSPAVRFRGYEPGTGVCGCLIVGEFWKQIRADGKLKKKWPTPDLKMEDTIRSFFNCPLRIPTIPTHWQCWCRIVLLEIPSWKMGSGNFRFDETKVWRWRDVEWRIHWWKRWNPGRTTRRSQSSLPKKNRDDKKSRTRLHYLFMIRKRWRLKQF